MIPRFSNLSSDFCETGFGAVGGDPLRLALLGLIVRHAKDPDTSRHDILPCGRTVRPKTKSSEGERAMPSALIEFWRRYSFSHAPYVHPDDRTLLESENRRYVHSAPTNFDEYVASDQFGDFEDVRFHLSLLPCFFAGDLRSADILIFLLNPGFSYSDYYAEFKVDGCKSRLQRMIQQDFDGIEFPFVWLDPDYCWHGGFNWWERKLREVIIEVVEQQFAGRYLDGLRSLSRRLAAIELVPYHAFSFRAHRLIDKLSSVKAAQAFAARAVESAAGGDKTIIVTRQAAQWGFAKGLPHVVVYEGGQTRGASLGVNTPGGRAILAKYGGHLA